VPFHELQAEQIRRFRETWTAAGHQREPRVSVSRSIFALIDDRDRAYFGRGNQVTDQVGYIDAQTKAIFGRSYAAEPDVLVKELAGDTAIQAADTLLLTVPNQLGVEYTLTPSRASSGSWPGARLAVSGQNPLVEATRARVAPPHVHTWLTHAATPARPSRHDPLIVSASQDHALGAGSARTNGTSGDRHAATDALGKFKHG